ncbi:hypothetical protein RJ640_007715 [Escallonia rubra]|uniref:Cytochrome P450 n=1 Tax=Escallonia rubra TaxID=112253 RepID=A0AA88QL69_9ASTE|nr:hypothetical protein RJ640_007715 [Escallonia rubra]
MVLEYFPSFAILLVSLLFLYMVVKQWKGSKSTLPPGPKKLPLIGNLHQLIGSPLPHHALRDLANKYGPVMHLKLGELTTIIISSPEAAEAALKTHEHSIAQRPIFATVQAVTSGGFGVIFAPYGDYWRQMRKLCTLELLSAKRVRSFRPVREEVVTKFIESIHGSSTNGDSVINMTDKIFQMISSITSRAMFGNECQGNEFIKLVKEANVLADAFDITELFPSFKIFQFFSSKKSTLKNLTFLEREQILRRQQLNGPWQN